MHGSDDIPKPDEHKNTHTPQPTEEELRQLYIEQQRRMSCPGCGEDFEVF